MNLSCFNALCVAGGLTVFSMFGLSASQQNQMEKQIVVRARIPVSFDLDLSELKPVVDVVDGQGNAVDNEVSFAYNGPDTPVKVEVASENGGITGGKSIMFNGDNSIALNYVVEMGVGDTYEEVSPNAPLNNKLLSHGKKVSFRFKIDPSDRKKAWAAQGQSFADVLTVRFGAAS